ncbi:MAG: TylF/MycF/NovP-related O-methyltransferase [Planctomycetota bacterium]|nr:TylF/MycF/NovP-related O-methyltransferase [Planctomycetota bacterium]
MKLQQLIGTCLPEPLRQGAKRLNEMRRGWSKYGALDRTLAAHGMLASDRARLLRVARPLLGVSQLPVEGFLHLELMIRSLVERSVHGSVVECGVWRGGAAAFMAEEVSYHCDKRPHMYFFDSFEGMPRMTRKDGDRAGQMLYGRDASDLSDAEVDGALQGTGQNDADEARVRCLLSRTRAPQDTLHLVKGWFQNTLPAWKDRIGPIALLHIDGDFYESTKACLEQLGPQVVPGGVVILDDYGVFA